MTLTDIIQAIDKLTLDEQQQLQIYLTQHVQIAAAKFPDESQYKLKKVPLDMDELLKAAAEIREGFTESELIELEHAMNDDYFEPIDEDGFPSL